VAAAITTGSDEEGRITDNTEKLLKELTEANGVAGYESEARSAIGRYLDTIGEITEDKMGSLSCRWAEGAVGRIHG
jgi:putative aminopeptidase FrvX